MSQFVLSGGKPQPEVVSVDIVPAVLLLEASRGSDGTFGPQDVVEELRRRGSTYAESTIRTHVVSRMCANAPDHHARTFDDLVRVSDGRYRFRQNLPRD